MNATAIAIDMHLPLRRTAGAHGRPDRVQHAPAAAPPSSFDGDGSL